MTHMLETLKIPERADIADSLHRDIAKACGLIPPLWDLRSFVAVNPFLGFGSTPVDSAARAVRDGIGADILPSFADYARRWRNAEFGKADVQAAARRVGVDARYLEDILDGKAAPPARWRMPVRTFAEWHDWRNGTAWQATVTRIVARWCAVHAADGDRAWRLPAAASLWDRWRAAAVHDRTLDVAGLRGFRLGAGRLPEDPDAAIAAMLGLLEIDATDREQYLYRLLGSLHGWASWYRRAAWEHDRSDVRPVRDLLAILICMDAAVASLAPRAESRTKAVPESMRLEKCEDERTRLALQEALEDGATRRLLANIRSGASAAARTRPTAQAVFCIDVRSEILRRHLEAAAPTVRTHGFAGFFGVAMRLAAADAPDHRCPVLLQPRLDVRLEARRAGGGAMAWALAAPAAAFSAVELLGTAFAIRMTADAAGSASKPDQHEEQARFALPLRDEADSALLGGAELVLRTIGRDLARVVLLCGHSGHSANNPHAAGLQCGACGGHGGALNARVAAAALNDPSIRSRLGAKGYRIPADTCFIAGVHDTSTDEVRLLDLDTIPETHRREVSELQSALVAASAATCVERSCRLGMDAVTADRLPAALRRRANDWSETRPEWALAGNMTFVAARRDRTRTVNLEGRAFLHDYDSAADPDGDYLRLILAAPLVVASWINLQYFASTVDNTRLGAGDKLLHNRIGSVGVVLGNGGDLRPGLPLQSIMATDGTAAHDPIRLQAVIEAPREVIEAALAECSGTRDLIECGWVRLFALEAEGDRVCRYVPGEGWEDFDLAQEACEEDHATAP